MKLQWLKGMFRALGSSSTSAHPRAATKKKLRAEQLESRAMLAVRIWDGGAAFNDHWTDRDNWVENIAPVAGDELVFPAGIGLLDRSARNDFPTDTIFSNISVKADDYKLTGNRFQLSGRFDFLATGKLNLEADIKVRTGNHVINAAAASETGRAEVVLNNVISDDGTTGGLFFRSDNRTAVFRFKGNRSNTYSKPIDAVNVRMILNKDDNVRSISGPFRIIGPDARVAVFDDVTGDRHALGQFLPGTAVTVIDSVNTFSVSRETLGKLTLQDGKVGVFPTKSSLDPQFDGLLTLQQPVEVFGAANSSISGEAIQISTLGGSRDVIVNSGVFRIGSQIKGGTLFKKGAGELILSGEVGNSSFAGLVVESGNVSVTASGSGKIVLPNTITVGKLGSAQPASLAILSADHTMPDDTSVTVRANGSFVLEAGVIDTISRLTLAGGQATIKQTSTLTLNQDLDASSNAVVTVETTSRLNVLDDTFINGSQLQVDGTSSAVLGDGLTMTGATVNTVADGFVLLGGRLLVNNSATTSVIGGEFQLKQGSHEFLIHDGSQPIDLRIDANVRNAGNKASNTASVNKTGLGTVRFTGANTNTGNTTLTQGKLVMDGALHNSNIIALPGTQLSGTGTAKTASMNSGSVLRPGLIGPGVLHTTTTGLLFGSKFAPVLASAVSFDQLQTTNLILDRFLVGDTPQFATLEVTRNFTVPLNTSFKLIDVTGAAPPDPQTIFQDPAGVPLPDGSTFLIGGQNFTINYDGGDGNDVVITRNNPPAFANRTLTPVITEGGLATLTGHITEPDAGDTFFLDVDWGDGSKQTYRFAPGTPPDISVTHRYLDDLAGDNNTFPVKLAWRDQKGATNRATMSLVVNNAAPVINNLRTVVSDATDPAGLVTLSARLTDAGLLDTKTVLVQWRPGESFQRVDFPAGSNVLSLQHRYPRSGQFLITLVVIDDDGASSAATTLVKVP